MLNNPKIDLLDNLNFIFELVQNQSLNFPDRLFQFFKTEFDQLQITLATETKENIFMVSGSTNTNKSLEDADYFSIKNYSAVKESIKLEVDPIINCELITSNNETVFSSYLFTVINEFKYLLILESKYPISDEEGKRFKVIVRFVQKLMNIWKRKRSSDDIEMSAPPIDFFRQCSTALVKEIKTTNGLLTLVKEERLSNIVENYFDAVKAQNMKLLKQFNQLIELITHESKEYKQSIEKIQLSDFLNNCIAKVNNEFFKIQFSSKIDFDDKLKIDRKASEGIIENCLHFMASLKSVEKIRLTANLSDENRIAISIRTNSSGIIKEQTNYLLNTAEPTNLLAAENGLSMILAKKYLSMIGGNLNFNELNSDFIINISIPITDFSKKSELQQEVISEKRIQDRILLVESDSALTSLLKKYLSKWNYMIETANTGNRAVDLINENKYLAIIVNIDQNSENSLKLIQQIKNKKESRNTPVIIFSVEPDNEKIYLMGSVDYLVKPVNYNNLVEILTSYKLRMDSNVLCVDDDLPTLNLLKQAVQTAGFNAVAINRSEHVIDEIRGKDIDLAIIDLDMPILNGFDLIKNIKSLEKFAKLPIIIYTGQEDYQNDLKSIEGLFVDLLEKRSTSFNELENTIIDMIKNYEEPNIKVNNIENSEGPRILMAEDYKHSQIIVTRLLKKSGFTNIIVVENGEEALKICENDKIDLILMDMQMPVMNGFEATGKIREIPGYSDTPIIALTAFAMKGDREKCLEAGTTDYIPKPIDSKEFIEKVQYYTQVVVNK